MIRSTNTGTTTAGTITLTTLSEDEPAWNQKRAYSDIDMYTTMHLWNKKSEHYRLTELGPIIASLKKTPPV